MGNVRGWHVVCDGYVVGPISDKAVAEQRLAGITEKASCMFVHEVAFGRLTGPGRTPADFTRENP